MTPVKSGPATESVDYAMITKVELTNDSYSQRVRILIDGKEISEYSSLRRYMDEPFAYWCDSILGDIYEECGRGRYSLRFASRREETEIMQVLAESDPNCEHYSSGTTPYPDSLQDRMRALSQIVANNRDLSMRYLRRDVLFVIPESLCHLEAELRGLEVRNAFCEIIAKVARIDDYIKQNVRVDLVILLVDGSLPSTSVSKLAHDFEIRIDGSGASGFVAKTCDTFVYRSTEDGVFDTIFSCLLLSPLLEMFRSCLATLPDAIEQRHHKELVALRSIYPNVIPVPESNTIELGRSVRIRFDTACPGHNVGVAELLFSYSPNGVIRCNGLVVEGLREGASTLYVYRHGDNDPCAQEEFKVIKRNRIAELTLDDVDICIGEGDRYSLALSYLPTDADNASEIVWEAEDRSVAKVDARGNVVGVRRGATTIRCFAENVSTRCRCVVKPYLQTITPDEDEIDLMVGDSYPITYVQSPDDCINDQLVISSMDMRIALITGSKILALSIGTTRAVIQNSDESVRAEIVVNVLSERDYNKKQKQRAKDEKARNKKGGWLSKLFGV